MASAYIFMSVLLSYYAVCCLGAAHGHDHKVDNNLERESDGAYRPRDWDHYKEERHNSEFDHEAILGSVKEAEQFDKLSPEESKERLAELLPNIDLNNNEQIDREELEIWILNNFVKLSAEEAAESLKESDDNLDGILSWQEYLRDAFGVDDEQEIGEDDRGDVGMLVHEEKAMWSVADADGDGHLDIKEFQVFSNPEEHSKMYPYLVNQTMREKDKNGDGYLDFLEYIGDRDEVRDPEWLEAERTKFSYELDLDQDGKLNVDEVEQWVIPNNKQIAKEEVEHLFDAADDDNNGVLSFTEVIRHYDIFVGSEATDYGDMLQGQRDEL